MKDRVELPKLRECPRCRWALCLCAFLKAHKPTCTRRRAIMAEIKPEPCAEHLVVACEKCWPCDCNEAA